MTLPFDLHQVRCFIAIAEELHFGRAAARLHLTQPPLSRQIKLLESRLGVTLIERDQRGVALTAAGIAFLRGARELMQTAMASVDLAREAAGGQPDRLAIAFTPVTTYVILPSLLQRLWRACPGVELALRELMTLPQLSALMRKDIDAALLRPSISLKQFNRMQVGVDELVAVLPAGHALARRKSLTLQDFDRQPFIGHDANRAKYLCDITERGFAEAGVAPRLIQSLTEPQAMLALVKAGLGLAIVAGQVGRHSRDPALVFRPLRAGSLPPIETWLVWRKGARSKALDGLVSAARQWVKESRT